MTVEDLSTYTHARLAMKANTVGVYASVRVVTTEYEVA